MAIFEWFGFNVSQIYSTVLVIVVSFLFGQMLGSKIIPVPKKNVWATSDGFKTPVGLLLILIVEFLFLALLAAGLEALIPNLFDSLFAQYGFWLVSLGFAVLIGILLFLPLIGNGR